MASAESKHLKFQYQPLDHASKQIRLLKHQGDPKMLDGDSSMKFEIITVSLEHEPGMPYHAISYAWGIDSEHRSILLNDCLATVPCSAEQALRGILRGLQLLDEAPTILIWIDAVCIQQANLAEKSTQVAMMGEIYASGESVLVWLGEDDGTTETALETVRLVVENCSTVEERGKDIREVVDLPLEERGQLSEDEDRDDLSDDEDPLSGCDWMAFGRLLSCRWFSRLWVLQEVAHAKRVRSFRGRYLVPWDALTKAALSEEIRRRGFEGDMWVQLSVIDGFFTVTGASLNGDLCFDDPLLLNFGFQTSNAFDRVYALLGLDQYADAITLHPGERILVDYGQCLEVVYAQATYLAIVHAGNFSLLGLTDLRSLEPDWPSWVPRFNELGSFQEKMRSYCLTVGRPLGAYNGRMCNASGHSQLLCSRSVDCRVLHADGVSVGRIATVLSLAPLEDLSDAELYTEAVYERIASNWCHRRQSSLPGIFAQLAAFLHSKSDNGLQIWCRDVRLPDFAAFVTAITNYCPSPCEPKVQRLLELTGSNEGYGHSFVSWLLSIIQALRLSALAQLQDESFAFCVGSVQAGDELIILFGGKAVFVVRKTNDQDRLRGFADVPGIMDGEYVQRLRDDGRLESETKTFAIH